MAVKRWMPKRPQEIDNVGLPLSGGTYEFFVANSSTNQDTYTTSAGTTANSNPMTLDSSGRPSTEIWLTVGETYKVVCKDSTGATIWTEDNVAGINDATVTLDEWASGPAPTYVSATSFTLVGDQTTVFHTGRRLKTTNSGGTIYSIITASSFASLTTVQVVNDSGTLDAGLSAVSYGLISAENSSAPLLTDTTPIVSGSIDTSKKVRVAADSITTGTTRILTAPDKDSRIGIQEETVVASTTGTSISFTSIPAGVKRVSLALSQVSIDATTALLVRVGPSGGLVTSGYTGSGATLQNAVAIVAGLNSAGFNLLGTSATAATVVSGIFTLQLVHFSNEIWTASWSGGFENTAATFNGGGNIDLSGALTQISLTTTGGNVNFDAGNVNVFYE